MRQRFRGSRSVLAPRGRTLMVLPGAGSTACRLRGAVGLGGCLAEGDGVRL